ncbi:MAG: hypothetical protein OXC46_07085, partial [Thaumarchaeota archaeon]|nr:hypothetical protein [Nitrososphaerota archaeon]
ISKFGEEPQNQYTHTVPDASYHMTSTKRIQVGEYQEGEDWIIGTYKTPDEFIAAMKSWSRK